MPQDDAQSAIDRLLRRHLQLAQCFGPHGSFTTVRNRRILQTEAWVSPALAH